MAGDITSYTALVTNEHQGATKFMASLAAVLQPVADQMNVIGGMPQLYDLDYAVGDQLDSVGLWIGETRKITEPLVGTYFSWDTTGAGWDEAIWFQAFDPTTKVITLPDDHYRLLLYAKIAANNWDGTIPGAYAAWDILFSSPVEGPILIGPEHTVLIQDNQDMSMLIGFLGPPIDVLTQSLLTGGHLQLKPVGVRINGYVQPSIYETKFFGFDVESDTIGGWDEGSWAVPIPSLV